MTAQTKTVLKSYFETGDRPTEQQFADLIDSIPGDAGVLSESEIPATIARDTEVTAAVSAHAAASDPHGDRAYAAAQDAALIARFRDAYAGQWLCDSQARPNGGLIWRRTMCGKAGTTPRATGLARCRG